ncbi:protein O-GlcNAcase-like isoform X5 [Lathamus discolor]|uniref:protein O-GlcNAcase-like isoform X5 n=1 Tax=Lathamus discolor TaxID=678569 RepID=UPI0032B72E59
MEAQTLHPLARVPAPSKNTARLLWETMVYGAKETPLRMRCVRQWHSSLERNKMRHLYHAVHEVLPVCSSWENGKHHLLGQINTNKRVPQLAVPVPGELSREVSAPAGLRRWGLNCYMYAPKDELKHRLLWREPYTEHEAAHMRSLIEAAQERGVQFVFAISAGQDMVFSSAGDRLLLQQKLRQVAAMGCQAFALLFDDIDPCMCQADRDAFPSLAQAQASVANEVYQELGQPPVFLFCPTEYCSSLCSPSPSQSCYLLTIGRELLPGIGVIWTGEHPARQCGICGPVQLLSGSAVREPCSHGLPPWRGSSKQTAPSRSLPAPGCAAPAGQAGGRAVGVLAAGVRWGDLTLIPLLSTQVCACPYCERAHARLCCAAPGPKVVSQELSPMLLEEVEGVLRRRPIIWDNLYANDYDCRRVFLGPYTGRAPGLMARLHGLLLNPNCELQANFIPIHTLGSWFRSELGSCAHPDHTGMEPAAGQGDSPGPQDGSYSPQEALELALHDWVAEINQQALEPGARSPGHASVSLKGGAELKPDTVGWDVLPDPRPHGTVPSGTDQHGPEPCGTAPEEGRRKVTLEPEQDSGSRARAGGQQSPAGDREQLAAGSTESSEPASAVPSTAQTAQPTGAPAAAETLHSPGPPVCRSDGTSAAQNILPTGDARTGAGSSHQPCSSTQPEPSRADMPQTPPGPGAGASPVPTAPLIDGAGASPGPTASLTLEEARSSPMSLLIMEEARTSPTALVTPEEPNLSPMAPLTPEEARSSPTAPLTPEEPRSSPTAPLTPEEPRSSPTAPLTLGEVRMLVELFYLPYHHGPLAQRLLEHFRWLRANSLSVGVSAAAPDAGAGRCWRGRAQSFTRLCAQTCRLHARLVGAAGRALLYDLHPYLWDVRNVLLAASAFVQWLDGHLLCEPGPTGAWGSCFGWCQSITAPILPRGDAEPWARRGGLFGELQALLPVGNSSDLFYQPPPLFPSRQLYVLHPLQPRDKGELYRMCRESLDCDPKVTEILVAHPDLLGDRLLGSFLSLSPEYTFVLEDEAGPCGYAAGVLCAEGFLQQRDSGWLPAMRHKYPQDLAAGAPALGKDALEEALLFFHTEPAAVPLPVLQRFPSLVQLGTAARTLDTGASRSLALCLLSALRANGEHPLVCVHPTPSPLLPAPPRSWELAPPAPHLSAPPGCPHQGSPSPQ